MGTIVNKRQLADVFGVSVQAITNWQKDGMPVVEFVRGPEGSKYDTAMCIQWRLDRLVNAKVASANKTEYSAGGIINKDAEDARLTKERADNLELKNAILRREYAPVTSISAVLAKVCVQIAGVLDSLPLNIKRKVPSLTVTDLEVIKREVVKCQNAASKVGDLLNLELDTVSAGGNDADA